MAAALPMAQHICSISIAQIRRPSLSHYRRPAIGVIVILVNPERGGSHGDQRGE
jgi:hypothetical protein